MRWQTNDKRHDIHFKSSSSSIDSDGQLRIFRYFTWLKVDPHSPVPFDALIARSIRFCLKPNKTLNTIRASKIV